MFNSKAIEENEFDFESRIVGTEIKVNIGRKRAYGEKQHRCRDKNGGSVAGKKSFHENFSSETPDGVLFSSYKI